MKKFVFLFLALVFSSFSFSQDNSANWVVNAGCHRINSKGLMYFPISDEESYPVSQKPAYFFDVNFLYTKPICSSLKNVRSVFGAGLNQKGFIQNGIEYEAANYSYPYEKKIVRNYGSVYAGMSYDIINLKKIRFTVGILLNPDFDISQATERFARVKIVSLASRSFLSFDYFITEKMALSLRPYFQAPVIDYAIPLKDAFYSTYKPYGFGLNVGLVFAKKS